VLFRLKNHRAIGCLRNNKVATRTDAESAWQGAFAAPTNPKVSIDTIVQ